MLVEPVKRRFTVEEYHRMGEAGILHADDRVELIEGEIVQMSPIGRSHAFTVMMLNNLLVKAVGGRALVSPGNPVRLTRWTEPQPDLMLLRLDADYREEFVVPGHVLLVIEVADTSLAYERVEVHRDPAGETYRAVEVVPRSGRLCPAALPDVQIAAGEIL